MIERELRIRIGADAARIAGLALQEDGPEDITTDLCIPGGQFGTASIMFRAPGVLAGMPYADAVAGACEVGPIIWSEMSGSAVAGGQSVGVLQGDLARILRAERPVLNLLQRAVGIATTTRAYVDAVAGTGCRVLHTRKTAPGLRLLDVSAVLAGGGNLHRADLSHTLMVKDNHWRALERSGRSLEATLADAHERGIMACQVEVESVEQVRAACAAGASRLLIDNQSPGTVREWAGKARALRPGIEIEATGGITLETVLAYAEAGADFVSVGALTHSVRAADISLDLTAG